MNINKLKQYLGGKEDRRCQIKENNKVNTLTKHYTLNKNKKEKSIRHHMPLTTNILSQHKHTEVSTRFLPSEITEEYIRGCKI